MASFAKQFSLFLLFTFLSSLHTHARDSQFFNKIPSTTNTVLVPTTNEKPVEQQPDFLPDNENSYGLYGHESGQLPPSSTTSAATKTQVTQPDLESTKPVHKYLPKNYNPVAYVTEPEQINDNDNSNYYNNYNNQQVEEKTEYRSYDNNNNFYNNGQQEEEKTEKNNNNFYYNGGSSFNSQPQGMSDTRFGSNAVVNSRERYFNNGGEAEADGFRAQPQGMSDTRFVENGKYHYDVKKERYNNNHPYESLRGVNRNEYDNRSYYGNRENTNAYEFDGENSMGGDQNQEEFQEEDNSMP